MDEIRFKKLCEIAKINVLDNKREFQKTLASIGEWVSKIHELNLEPKDTDLCSSFNIGKDKKELTDSKKTGCLPTMSKEINVFKLDVSRNCSLEKSSLFKNAPDHDSNYFRVFSYIKPA